MKKKYIVSMIGVVVLIGVIVALLGLGSSKPYTIQIDLAPETRREYEEKLQLFSQKLEEEKPKGAQSAILGDYYIEKARYQGYLGQLSESEKTLKDGIRDVKISSVMANNLAKINEQMKRYGEAMKYYEMLIADYQMDQYDIDLAKAARLNNDVAKAKEAYWKYQMIYKQPDAEFEKWLRSNQ